jgi:putative SOS response-associated peptidase YedK
MCGRFTLTATPEALNKLFPLFEGLDLQPQYNIAPSHNVLAVRLKPGSANAEAVRLRWGLIPSWADDAKIGYKLINARLETVREKPSFRAAFKHRRCLILADGFFEWQKTAKAKQPYHIRLRDGGPFAFAGLWEKWEREGNSIQSCTILTTDANATVREVHNRMPVIVEPKHYQDWLTAPGDSKASMVNYLGPYAPDALIAIAVNPVVNNPRANGPECLVPAEPEAQARK